MRSFRGFADRYLVPNAGVIELRQPGSAGPALLLGGSVIHLPGALAQRPR